MRTRLVLILALVGAFSLAIPAVALAPGSVLWHDEIHIANGNYTPDLVEGAAGRVVMVGSATTDTGDQDIRIRTYSAATGTLLWDKTYDRAGGYEFATDLIVTPQYVVVVGGAQATASSNVDALVLRYEAKTGNLVWASFWDGGAGEDAITGAAISGKYIAVAGQTQTSSASMDVLVQTYKLTDGSLSWSYTYDGNNQWDNANAVAISSGVVVSVGQSTGSDGYYDLFVSGHDLKSGGLKWLKTYDPGFSARGLATVASGSRVYVVGDETASGTDSADVMVRAYDSKTGALIWGDSRDYGYGFYDSAYDVDVGGGMVVATGEGRPSSGSPDLWTLAFDTVTGNLMWNTGYDVAGSVDQAWAVEITGSSAVIAGGGYDGDHEWVVQAYDLATGAISWQEIHDRSGGSDAAYGITALGNDIYVVGFTQEAGTGSPGTHGDGTIRSYQR